MSRPRKRQRTENATRTTTQRTQGTPQDLFVRASVPLLAEIGSYLDLGERFAVFARLSKSAHAASKRSNAMPRSLSVRNNWPPPNALAQLNLDQVRSYATN